MSKAVIVRAKRSAIGKENGYFKNVEVQHLLAPLLKHLSEGLEEHLNDVIIGNIVGPGGNIARLSSLQAGLPIQVPGLTIDRQCSAGLEAIRLACYLVEAGAGDCYIAGGVESVSTSPFEKRARFSPDEIGDPDMGVAAEHVANKYQITREEQDAYASLSFERTWEAFEKGMYKPEILPIEGHFIDEVFIRKRDMTRLLSRSAPIFVKNGTVTAANSCSINDGACAVVVMSEDKARSLTLQPILRFVDSEVTGVHPFYPGIAPVFAIRSLLEKRNLDIRDVDLFEINEAFASKVVACAKELDIPYEKLNTRGGSIIIGHPYSASGSILITRLFYEVQRRKDCRYVIAAIGSGGGIGLAMMFEVIS
ncbi:acetyl-CoA acetyltransferase [Heyndrickxia shackletonii]|uniref:Acetyl-CoA acetyltransferase n=1 Tax=Heyndrickxia shackletonii TaxID=157838 RepID=A0A0Q3WT42_9BACI|nr:acetyl-CoA C-acyltransferase [Heyndrickxia shackletonii]KQL51447.1 acetyl-CoA acetyltransferase [Heyndrickxia shackletonii]NEZ00793.1 acetyl-CoA C-acyltransferase [Heyndrickxia shackletonii]